MLDYIGPLYDLINSIISFIIFLIFIISIRIIIVTICKWVLLKRADEKGWKALIPFYGTYTFLDIIGLNKYWIIVTILPVVFSFTGVLLLIFLILNIYFKIIFSISLSKSYGKSEFFGVGLFFLPIIFYPILVFSKSKYMSKKPFGDFIEYILNNNKNSEDDKIVEDSYNVKQCSNCGIKIGNDDVFCYNCGRKQV